MGFFYSRYIIWNRIQNNDDMYGAKTIINVTVSIC